jgi:hypothetical protein
VRHPNAGGEFKLTSNPNREHRNGLEGGDLLGSLLWLHL